ncbi:MAG: pyridoxamine 5-phosphate oxidase [Frankiales bacterium]|nr:pyridoxamine 5-phosphate oxidase [Frankiales bacterium]
MAKVYDGLEDDHVRWIGEQQVFFVATAPLAGDGHVNLSPRGLDCLSVLGPRQVAWVDYTGSGVETIAHLRENGRITLMWCAFSGPPKILRVHGRGRVCLAGSREYDEVVARHPSHLSTRAVIVVDVDRVSDSCGYGVPLMDLVGERDQLTRWAENRGPEGLVTYRAENNAHSLDGLPGLTPEPVDDRG